MTTDRAGCFIGVVKIVDGKVSEFAGSAHPRGQNGTMYTLVGDGAAKNCRFLSPFGISAMYNNVLVVDKDRIRLITPTQQLRSYLNALLADAYGLKVREGEPRRPTLPIAQCLTPLNTLVARLDNIQSEATKRTGREQTDGTHASISEDTSNTVHRNISGLKSLQHNVHGLIKEDDVLVRSTVTDVNEHFHAEMRKPFESGMMIPLQFHISGDRRKRAQADFPGFHVPTERIASQAVVKRAQENSDQKEEVYEFNYGDIVAVAVKALPVSVRQIASTAVRESVVKLTFFKLDIPTHTLEFKRRLPVDVEMLGDSDGCGRTVLLFITGL